MLEIEPSAEKISVENAQLLRCAARHRAAKHYVELAQLHGGHANQEASEAFYLLAAEEAELAAQTGDETCNTIRAGEYPALFNSRDADASRSGTLRGYDVYAVAIRSCERMFDFWSYVSAHAQNDAVRKVAEQFAHEELRIASRRRTRRRAAYRAMMAEDGAATHQVPIDEAELQLDALLNAQIRNDDGRDLHMAQGLSALIRQRLENAERTCAMMPERILKNESVLSEFLADFYVAATGASGAKEATDLWAPVSTLALKRLALLRPRTH